MNPMLVGETGPELFTSVGCDYFFNSTERISRLLKVAESWLGTPWCANSSARGRAGGVSCHNLPRAVLIECGALPKDFPAITGDPNHSRGLNSKSIIEPFLDGRPEFKKIFDRSNQLWPAIDIGNLRPGDLLGLKICHCLDHLGIVISTGRTGLFMHTLMHKHTDVDQIAVPPWSQIIRAVWRPIDR